MTSFKTPFALALVLMGNLCAFNVFASNPEPEKLEIEGVWSEPAGPGVLIKLSDQYQYSMVLPDDMTVKAGDFVYVTAPEDNDSLPTLCFAEPDAGGFCAEVIPEPASRSTVHKVNRVLDSKDAHTSIVELDNLRLVGFENRGGFTVKPGDGVVLTEHDSADGLSSVCVFGKDESIFCTDSVSLNEDALIVDKSVQ